MRINDGSRSSPDQPPALDHGRGHLAGADLLAHQQALALGDLIARFRLDPQHEQLRLAAAQADGALGGGRATLAQEALRRSPAGVTDLARALDPDEEALTAVVEDRCA